MNNKLLVTRPKHDITNCYLFTWAEKIIKLANKKGIDVLDLHKNKANKKNITSMLKKMKPLLVFFNGHGNKNIITGHDNETVIQAGKNEELLKSKIIYALSCQSAKKLGPASLKNGASCYIGYEDDFVFFHNEESTNPEKDETAKLFLDPSNQLMISLLKGHCTEEAYNRSQELFKKNIQKIISSESEDNEMASWLFWDMKHQVCLGDKNAYFKDS